MTTIKKIIRSAVIYKGIEKVRRQAEELAAELQSSRAYILAVIREVERRKNGLK